MNRISIINPIILVVFALSGCQIKNKPETNNPDDTVSRQQMHLSKIQIEANNLVLGNLSDYEFVRTVKANGYIDALPGNKRVVSLWMGGTVKGLSLLPGDRVYAGQVLFQIENPAFLELQERFITAHELLKYQRDDFERQKQLASENVTAQKVLLKAQSDYAATKATVESLKEKLSLLQLDTVQVLNGSMISSLKVLAPISGYISSINATNGKFIPEASEVLEIINPHPLMLVIQVFETDIKDIFEGMPVRFSSPDNPSETYLAKIEKVGAILEDKRTIKVHAFFAPPANIRLIPGMFVSTEIEVERFTLPALPLTSIVSNEDRQFVMVKTNREQDFWILEKRTIITGYRNENMVTILPESKLETTDIILINGAFGVTGSE